MDSRSKSAAVAGLVATASMALRFAGSALLRFVALAGCVAPDKAVSVERETARVLAEAKQRADALGSQPSDVPELQRWLQDYEPWVRRLPEVEAQLAAVMQRAKPRVTPKLTVRGYDFASEADLEQARTLEITCHELRAIGSPLDPSHGLCGAVRHKLAMAQKAAAEVADMTDVERRDAESRAKAWDEAIAAIEKHELYGGMKLRAHEGLLPIGMDPESRLWEFVHVASGAPGKAIPVRDPATGRIVPDGDMGIVLVLLPGGTFWMGAQRHEESGPNYDPRAFGNEGPVHSVTLSPFFVGKYEVTQGQWLRWMGSNPSASRNLGELSLPVTNVSWNDVDAAARNAGLLLPTEAQWEYACRAGSSTPWWTGAEESDLGRGAVFGDAPMAAVGSKAANRFGLFDTTGNVFEWCRDAYAEYASAPVADPLVSSGPSRVYRGGCWFLDAGCCRSAARESGEPGDADDLLGFRVVMDVGVDR